MLKTLGPDLQNILRQSYDNARVTIDLRRTSNSPPDIPRRMQGFSRVRLTWKIVRSCATVFVNWLLFRRAKRYARSPSHLHRRSGALCTHARPQIAAYRPVDVRVARRSLRVVRVPPISCNFTELTPCRVDSTVKLHSRKQCRDPSVCPSVRLSPAPGRHVSAVANGPARDGTVL